MAHGWPDQTWTLARIKTLIGRGFHKSMALSKGVLRDHGPGARLGEVRVRTLSRLGFDVRVGIGPSITVAATAASAPVPEPGGAVVGRRPL